jgi:hypothetical protein
VLALFVTTVSVSALFVATVLRTPLRWVLGGPVRAAQRAALAGTPFAGAAARGEPVGAGRPG